MVVQHHVIQEIKINALITYFGIKATYKMLSNPCFYLIQKLYSKLVDCSLSTSTVND